MLAAQYSNKPFAKLHVTYFLADVTYPIRDVTYALQARGCS